MLANPGIPIVEHDPFQFRRSLIDSRLTQPEDRGFAIVHVVGRLCGVNQQVTRAVAVVQGYCRDCFVADVRAFLEIRR